MTSDADHTRQHIELAIERARDNVSGHLDEIDRQVRAKLDVGERAADYGPQLILAGIGVGFFMGFGIPRILKRLVQVAVPLGIAVKIVQAQQRAKVEGALPGTAVRT